MPKSIIIENTNRKIINPPRIKYCNTFLTHLRGFTFHPQLNLEEGLVLVGKRDSRADSSIHMLFVSFDLAVFWINSNKQVVDKIIAKSWKPAYFSKEPARYVLEIHPDRFGDYEIGDTVQFKDA